MMISRADWIWIQTIEEDGDGGWRDGGCQSRQGVGGGNVGWASVRLAPDQVAPISFSVAFTPSERSATLEGRSPAADADADGRMITMEMR